VSLLDQPALDLSAARGQLAELRLRIGWLLACALVLAVAGAALVVLAGGRWGVPPLIGAVAAAALGALALGDRRRLLVRLVAQDDAWSILEVRDFGRRLLSARERSRLARALAIAADAGAAGVHEFGVIRAERAHRVAGELRELAAAVADLSVPLRPRAAALCRRLLCEAALSPLYNPHVPERDLDRMLALIRAA
jgi:hypothetical protein